MKLSFALLLTVLFAAMATGAPMALRPALAMTAPPATAPEVSNLRPPDPQKELRQLSKDLKLNKDQRVGVSSILEERTREIQLLLDIQSVSEEYRQKFAAKVIADSDAQIATLLRNKQKRKFNRQLSRGRAR